MLQSDFALAAQEFHIPESVLLAVSYNESLWEWHKGPSTSAGFGLMHLTDAGSSIAEASSADGRGAPELPRGEAAGDRATSRAATGNQTLNSLHSAANLLGQPAEKLRSDVFQNIRGGAALLASYERAAVGDLPAAAGRWYVAVAHYSGSSDLDGARVFADDVYGTIRAGAARTTTAGQVMHLAPSPSVQPAGEALDHLGLRPTPASQAECPRHLDCDFVPAAYAQTDPNNKRSYGNYDRANRPADGNVIRYIVIHDTEGTYDATLQVFQDPNLMASSHYAIRSLDGHVTQVVPTRDIAWHAGNWNINMHAIGIEHEGFAVEGAAWYTETLYRSSARLVRYLAERFDIPLDRRHIFGHDEVPGPIQKNVAGMHWDPGTFWDWDHYMELLGVPSHESKTATDRPEAGDMVTIAPTFTTNQPPVTSCDASGCRQLPAQPANFVYLHSGPSPGAPLETDPALHPGGEPGTTEINDWSDKAVAGQTFVVADQQGDWTAIWYGGREAWFENPNGARTVPAHDGLQVMPRPGMSSIPVYGRAYPEVAAYPSAIPPQAPLPLDYAIPAGQVYVAGAPVAGDYFYAKTIDASLPGEQTLVHGQDLYYPIQFNHRHAFVKVSDVQHD
jgi:N-acetyl-anhydromuramyl-L-alanine amidase AmpD